MNYASIRKYDVANGEGIRTSIFVSGCTHHCKGCFNEETWDFNYGQPFTQEVIDEMLEYLGRNEVKGLTMLGGEPFEHVNQKGLLPLLRQMKEKYQDKTVWCYSGYRLDDDILGHMVKEWEETEEFLSYIDVLVDGEFIEEKKNISLRFKGSENQRIILVKETLQKGTIVEWDPKKGDYYNNVEGIHLNADNKIKN